MKRSSYVTRITKKRVDEEFFWINKYLEKRERERNYFYQEYKRHIGYIIRQENPNNER